MKRRRVLSGILSIAVLASAANAGVSSYTDETAYLNAVAAAGYATFVEDFEGSAWDPYRTTNPFSPNAAPSVTSLGITWSGNDLVTTNTNWGRNSSWGLYTIFGSTYTPEFFAGTSGQTLYAVGGWIDARSTTDIAIVIDGVIVAERPTGIGHQFIGAIVTTGFTSFQIIDLEQHSFLGADDFTFGIAAGMIGDIDGDGDVDLTDLAMLLSAFDTCAGDLGFNPAADFDGSGCVDLSDLAVLLANFGV